MPRDSAADILAAKIAEARARRGDAHTINVGETAAPRIDEWPWPADLLTQSSSPTPPFPLAFLPGLLGDFAADVADRMQCPVDFVGIPLIICAATLIGKEIRMAPKALDDWTERPCLWGGIIAESATMKTPAFNAALAPLRWLQQEFHKQHEKELGEYKDTCRRAEYSAQLWKEACKKAVKAGLEMPEKPADAEPPKPPQLRRLCTGDATQEALVDLIEKNPRGMLVFRDELSGWFASFNQYRPGSDRQFYLECHAGGSHAKDRRIGSVLIDDLYLSICGGVQPDIVTKVLSGGDVDGMTPRFSLLVWPALASDFAHIDRPPNATARHKTEFVMKELLELDAERFFGPEGSSPIRALRFDSDAQLIFTEWHTKIQLRIRGRTEAGTLRAHLGKYPGLFARLAAVHHLIRYVLGNASSPLLVDAATATAVENFIDGYLEPHARRIYRHLGQDPARSGARRIAQWIVKNRKLISFAARDVRQKDWSGLTTQDSVNVALDYLENVAGWVRCRSDLPGPKGGRASTRYLINPKVRTASDD
jgi:putative DNA primase/helicase